MLEGDQMVKKWIKNSGSSSPLLAYLSCLRHKLKSTSRNVRRSTNVIWTHASTSCKNTHWDRICGIPL